MRKEKNTGLTITISKNDLEMLEYLADVYDCSKTDIIKKCLKSSANMRKLFNDIDYNELSTSHKQYYVKCISDNYYLIDNRPLELKKLDHDGLITVVIENNKALYHKTKQYKQNNITQDNKNYFVDWLNA